MAKLLDVTLRDGGYKNRFQFQPELAMATVSALDAIGVEFIEVGYRNGSLKPIENIGPAGLSDDGYLQSIRQRAPRARLVVMVHPRNIQVEDLRAMSRIGVDMIRVCLNPKDLRAGLQTLEDVKELGMFASANITRASYLSVAEILAIAGAADHRGADVVYFADSNGHMVPEEVTRLTRELKDRLRAAVGFHPHNNLSLALANSIAAASSGADLIDSSLCGLGRGAGNLATELYVSYLERVGQNRRYDLVSLLKLADEWQRKDFAVGNPLSTDELLFGLANFSADFAKPIAAVSESDRVSRYDLGYLLSKSKPMAPVLEELTRLSAGLKACAREAAWASS